MYYILGFSEYFLYFNDDMFFGWLFKVSMFFFFGGVIRFIEVKIWIGFGVNNLVCSGFENVVWVNC